MFIYIYICTRVNKVCCCCCCCCYCCLLVEVVPTATKWYSLVSECYVIINKEQALVIQRLDSAIQRISLYTVDSAVSFPSTYPLYSDLSVE